jgi:phosphate starvation-inducible PhoH-like protein
MLPYEKLADHLEKSIIEIAPLAFMRGRTLDHAYVILDEAQNATVSQMKMFLTRMGQNAKFIITGDMTQVDLPKKQSSGLNKAVALLDDVEGISVIRLDQSDVIRHRLVTAIINAFEADSEAEEQRKNSREEK